jgi:hypothetical protein
MYWTTGSGLIELNITRRQAQKGSHQSSCDQDINELLQDPVIKWQLNKLDPSLIAKELQEYGAWDEKELQNIEQNKARLLWIACSEIIETLSSADH